MLKHEWIEENRLSWNAATARHNSHKKDQAAFLREGGSTLYPEEIEMLGDIHGRELLHLQCNAGQDTLSIASKLKAKVTGVDISDEAIDFARQLSLDSGIPGTFFRSDVYEWLESNTELYDVVYYSYGAVIWLQDLMSWAKGIHSALKPGGRLVLIDFHPRLCILDGALSGDWSEACDYMGGMHYGYEQGVGDYVAEQGAEITGMGDSIEVSEPFKNANPCHEFSWGLADIVSALLVAGLSLTTVREYPYSNGYMPYENMVELPGRHMVFEQDLPKMPLMYAIGAQKEDSRGVQRL